MPEELKNAGGDVNLTLEERRQKFAEEYRLLTEKYKLAIVPGNVTLALEDSENVVEN